MSRTITYRRSAALLIAVMALLVGVTSCANRPASSDRPADTEDPASAFPAQVQLPDQKPVTLTEQPKRIVSLSPTATETLYAIGAGKQVVAVDEYSNHPERAPQKKISALDASASAVSRFNPDLVIAPDSASELADGLREIDVPVLSTPSAADLKAAYGQIETLGKATGHADDAEDLVRRMRNEIKKIVRDTPKPDKPLTYYHEVSPNYFSAGPDSFVGEVYSKFGLRNIADPAQGKFPQLSAERVLDANPDLIFLADTKSAGVTAKSAMKRPGWNTLTAVKQGHVIELNDDIASRWGPRVVDLARSIGDAVSKAERK